MIEWNFEVKQFLDYSFLRYFLTIQKVFPFLKSGELVNLRTQFNNLNDYKKYPKDTRNDLKILKKLKVDLVFIPKTEDIYKKRRTKKMIALAASNL